MHANTRMRQGLVNTASVCATAGHYLGKGNRMPRPNKAWTPRKAVIEVVAKSEDVTMAEWAKRKVDMPKRKTYNHALSGATGVTVARNPHPTMHQLVARFERVKAALGQ